LNHCGQKKVSKFVALVYLVFYATPLQNMETEVDKYFFEQASSPQALLCFQWKQKIKCCPYVITRGQRKGEICGKSEFRPLERFDTFNPMCFDPEDILPDHRKHWESHPQFLEFSTQFANVVKTNDHKKRTKITIE